MNKIQIAQHDTSSDLQEKFESLFPTWPTVLATIIALLILLLVLTKLLYKPVKKMHDERRDYIQNNIDSAESYNNEAVEDREKANDELIQARVTAVEIINGAKEEAEIVRKEKIIKADAEVAKIIEDARENMKAQQVKFEEESEKVIVDIALAAAAKVIEKEVDNKTNQKIVKDFVKDQK